MAIDISGLSKLSQRKPEIIGKLLNRDTILKIFEPHEGYNPGPALFRFYEGRGDLGDCCEIPEGSGSFNEIKTDVACILSGNEFCEVDFSRYLNDFKFRFTAGREEVDTTLEEMIMDQELSKVAKNIDRLVWQGDTTLADNNLNKLEGLLKLADENVPASQQISIADGNMYQAVQTIITQIPLSAWDQSESVDIFMSLEAGKALRSLLINLNLYHYDPGLVNSVYDSFSFPGFGNVNIVPTRGLNHTDKVIATPRRNIHWLTNLADDHMTCEWDYNSYNRRYFWRIQFLLGLTFGIYENVLMASIDDAVLNNTMSILVSVVSPLGNNGGILTE